MPNASVIGDRAEVVLPAIDVLDHAVRRRADLPHALDGRFHLVRRPELKFLGSSSHYHYKDLFSQSWSSSQLILLLL